MPSPSCPNLANPPSLRRLVSRTKVNQPFDPSTDVDEVSTPAVRTPTVPPAGPPVNILMDDPTVGEDSEEELVIEPRAPTHVSESW